MLNKVIIIGHLGQDPEQRVGNRPVNLSVATSEYWRDRTTGERKQRTEWVRVVIFNEQLQGVAEKYLKKGSKVYLEGKLATRSWEDDKGVKRYSTEVVLNAFGSALVLLDKASGGGYQRPEGASDYGYDDDRAGGRRGDDLPDEGSDLLGGDYDYGTHNTAPQGSSSRSAAERRELPDAKPTSKPSSGPGQYFQGDPNKPPRTTMDTAGDRLKGHERPLDTRFDQRDGDEIPF